MDYNSTDVEPLEKLVTGLNWEERLSKYPFTYEDFGYDAPIPGHATGLAITSIDYTHCAEHQGF